MTQISEREACTKRSWYMGGAIGVLVAFLMLVMGDGGLIKALVVGALVTVVAGYLLMTFLCKDAPANAPQDNTRSAAAASAAAAPTASGSVSPTVGTVPAGDAGIGAAERASGPRDADEGDDAAPAAPIADTSVVADEVAAPAPKPETAAVDETSEPPVADTANVEEAPTPEPAARDDDAPVESATPEPAARDEDAPAESARPEPAAPELPRTKPTSLPEEDVHSAATASLDETAEAPLADREPDAAPLVTPPPTAPAAEESGTVSEEKPALLDAPRAEGADDLKRIGGIGPKMEQTLNDLGIYHFDQLAALNEREIAWVDSRLRFKGRIARDNWVGQAKTLADASDSQS
ncbi:hypothetical protein [Sulfitobacter sp. PS-8MA]|uniref:hypothetical protein n=1 Tax=Sulfitobacter sp. PS-8MA TaxID=3237707 RepID=UPI0034C5C1B0